MFSFHKPKIYRSNLGCCICKAKSSSSRFTDSTKYENEFERCFRLQEKRSGEICNACVLLVKRWKKLSPENKITKHWHHVVDARAGPGTKLTSNRRLTIHSANHNSQNNSSRISGSDSASKQQKITSKSELLPLSSSQSNNQSSLSSSTSTKGRALSLSKVKAVDTNVSTFTFGEPYGRPYLGSESSHSYASYSTMSRPLSGLNSTAFESVIKRFRQRKQQEMEAQQRLKNRRQINQQRGVVKRHQSQGDDTKSNKSQNVGVEQEKLISLSETPSSEQISFSVSKGTAKRLKKSSESNSFNIEGLRVSTLLDGSIWRKEKICCGTIFRGPYNELALFPKLLSPCQNRMNQDYANFETGKLEADDDDLDRPQVDSPPPRTTKSGSVSSCDSNTSGTGSMEQQANESHFFDNGRIMSIATRPVSIPSNKRKPHKIRSGDSDSTSSDSNSSRNKTSIDSPSSSSGMLLLVGDDEADARDEVLILGDDDQCDSSNDASSSMESISADMEGGGSGAIATS